VFDHGALECGPGQRVAVREDLRAASKSKTASKIVSFIAMADAQLPDDESPLRGEFLDACGDVKTKDSFRWNQTLIPDLLNSTVRAANDIVRRGGPVTGAPIDFAVQLGNATDNGQYNELRDFIDILDGGKIVNPDSGAPGYEGNQGVDPYPSPVSGTSLLDLGKKPFWATGLRRANGSPLPWYSVAGNHDVKVRGIVPNNDVWRAVAEQWATGQIMLNDLPPDQLQRVCADPTTLLSPTFLTELSANPKAARLTSADPKRRLLDRNAWAAEHSNTTGLPAGHGFTGKTRCKDASGAPLARLCYSIDISPSALGEPPVHLIALDDTPNQGLDDGNIDAAQWNWLNDDLWAHSACFFPAHDASRCSSKTGHASSLIIVLSNHSTATETNSTPAADGQPVYLGSDLDKLLLRFPNVILHASGHSQSGSVEAHKRPSGGGYWEINSPSIADFPHQSRVIEVVDNHDGTLSIFGTNFDAAAPVDPAAMRWSADPTPEQTAAFGSTGQSVNEEMLASIGRWVGANDPQSGASLAPAASDLDRNVEVVLEHPTGGVRLKLPAGSVFRFPRIGLPRFPFRGFPFPLLRGPGLLPPFPLRPPITFPRPQFPTYARTRFLGSPGHGSGLPISWYLIPALGILGAAWLSAARVRRKQVGL